MRELYSKTKLSLELGVDRRTLDKRLDQILHAKDGARNSKLYFMKDVFNAFIAATEEDFKNRKSSVKMTPEDKQSAGEEMANAKLRQAIADAELAEIKVAKENSALVEAERVEEIWGNMIAAFRARLLSLPSRAAVQTAGLDSKAVEKRLDDMIREALDELSRGEEEEDSEEILEQEDEAN